MARRHYPITDHISLQIDQILEIFTFTNLIHFMHIYLMHISWVNEKVAKIRGIKDDFVSNSKKSYSEINGHSK